MLATTVAERDHEELGALENALHLQAKELVATRSQRECGLLALLGDQPVDLAPKRVVGDADEAPRLHQSDAWRGVRCLQQSCQDVVGHHRTGRESAHVATLRDDPVHGPPLVRAERVLAHAGQRTFMGVRTEVLVTATELAQLIADGSPMTVLDVRWQLTQPDGRAAHAAGHVPGAVYVSLEDDLTDHAVTGRGRHPLPSGPAVQAAARRWGIDEGATVVVYDDWNRAGSARAWWVLRAAGLRAVRILDGGLAAWTAAGGVLEAGVVTADPGDVIVTHDDLYAGAMPTLRADDAAALGARLIDARAPERFRGDVEPVDAVAGHIPGATNVPSTSLLDADGAFVSDADLADVLGDVDGVYCGSGVTAAVAVAALAAIGVDAALFPGSWSQWSAETARPVATGG
ncbi:MAG: thiosulfate/3-mercaptopyruvate sulfurtransferase [Mycobacterium sp.]|nr:thiosulfate/3-mercaptopyruvate sulfurtransferase [Mycobacterium sp.]